MQGYMNNFEKKIKDDGNVYDFYFYYFILMSDYFFQANKQMQSLLDSFTDQVNSSLENIKSKNRNPVLISSGGNPFIFKDEKDREVSKIQIIKDKNFPLGKVE